MLQKRNPPKSCSFRAPGGGCLISKTKQDPEADLRELERYDRKVYIACGEMIAATERELRGLGVPFFSVKEWFIRRDRGANRETVSGDGVGGAQDRDGKIGEEELMALRRRMVELLEDLCKE